MLVLIQEFAKKNNLLIVDTYIDRAMTGTNDLRPDFQRMIKDSGKKQWNYVIVYKLDRFSRNKYEATVHKHTLSNNGVKVLSAMENIPDTPEGIILESLLEGMNQYYSAELSQKVLRGLNESYIKGQFTGGSQLYGYKLVNKKSVLDENEAPIIKEFFLRYSKGETAKSIGDNLNARGIRSKTGRYLDKNFIYKTLSNAKYVGKVTHRGKEYNNIYPAIIDERTWNIVQDIRKNNKHQPGSKKQKYNFLLSGKLVCGYCCHFLVGESGRSCSGDTYKYYNCLTKRRRKKECALSPTRKDWLENEVFQKTWELFNDNNNLDLLAEAIYKKHIETNKEDYLIKSLKKKRDEAHSASINLISAIEQGIITEQTKIRLKELESQISQYDFDIEQVKQRNYSFLTIDNIKTFIKSAINGNIESPETREIIVRNLIREIILYEDKMIIAYNFTENPFTTIQKFDNTNDIGIAVAQKENNPIIKNSLCSYKAVRFPPIETHTNLRGRMFFYIRNFLEHLFISRK